MSEIEPVVAIEIPQATLNDGNRKCAREYEKQSRASYSTTILSLDLVDWGPGNSAAAHSPSLPRRQKPNGEPRRNRKSSDGEGNNKELLEKAIERTSGSSTQQALEQKKSARRLQLQRQNSEPRVARLRGAGRDNRRRHSGDALVHQPPASPRNNRRRARQAAAASTTLQRSSSCKNKRTNRRTPQNADAGTAVDTHLAKSSIKW